MMGRYRRRRQVATVLAVLMKFLTVSGVESITGALRNEGDSIRVRRKAQEEGLDDGTENKNNDGSSSNNTPSVVAIVFGSLLVAIAVVALSVQGFFFFKNQWEKRRERLASKNRSKTPQGPMSHFSGRNPSNGPSNNYDGDMSSSSSSKAAAGSDSSSQADLLAQELKIAANRDSRIWKDYEHNKMRLVEQGKVVGMADESFEDELESADDSLGMIRDGEESSTKLVVLPSSISPTSSPPRMCDSGGAGSIPMGVDRYYPYGDEDDKEPAQAPPGTQLSPPRIHNRHLLRPDSVRSITQKEVVDGSPDMARSAPRREHGANRWSRSDADARQTMNRPPPEVASLEMAAGVPARNNGANRMSRSDAAARQTLHQPTAAASDSLVKRGKDGANRMSRSDATAEQTIHRPTTAASESLNMASSISRGKDGADRTSQSEANVPQTMQRTRASTSPGLAESAPPRRANGANRMSRSDASARQPIYLPQSTSKNINANDVSRKASMVSTGSEATIKASNETYRRDVFKVPTRNDLAADSGETETLVQQQIIQEFRAQTAEPIDSDDADSSDHRENGSDDGSAIELMKSLTPTQEEHENHRVTPRYKHRFTRSLMDDDQQEARAQSSRDSSPLSRPLRTPLTPSDTQVLLSNRQSAEKLPPKPKEESQSIPNPPGTSRSPLTPSDTKVLYSSRNKVMESRQNKRTSQALSRPNTLAPSDESAMDRNLSIAPPWTHPSDELSNSGDSSDSMPTAQIIKEVEVLKNFVKSYEKRRERQQDRNYERHHRVESKSPEAPSSPSDRGYQPVGSSLAEVRGGLRGSANDTGSPGKPRRTYFLRRSEMSAPGEDTGDKIQRPHSWSTDSTTGDSSDPADGDTDSNISGNLNRDRSAVIALQPERPKGAPAIVEDNIEKTSEHHQYGRGDFAVPDDGNSGDVRTSLSPPRQISERKPPDTVNKSTEPTIPAKSTTREHLFSKRNEPKYVRFDEQANSLQLFDVENSDDRRVFSPDSPEEERSNSNQDKDPPHGRYGVGEGLQNLDSSEESWESLSEAGSDGLRLGIVPYRVQSPPLTTKEAPKQHNSATRANTPVLGSSQFKGRTIVHSPQKLADKHSSHSPARDSTVLKIPAPGSNAFGHRQSPPIQQAPQNSESNQRETAKVGKRLKKERMPIQEIRIPSPPPRVSVSHGADTIQQDGPQATGNISSEAGDEDDKNDKFLEGNKDMGSEHDTTNKFPERKVTVIPTPSPTRRHNNKKFSNIVSMFEAKPKNSIYPPSESWQYNC